MVKLKICGMKFPENIAKISSIDPAYMGFIFYPASKRFLADLDPDLVKAIPRKIKTTGVFVNEELTVVKERIVRYGLQAVQLHGNESPEYCASLSGTAEVIKAFGIDDQFNFNILERYVDTVDYFLFDTPTPGYGGSGKTFSWQLLEKYKLSKPYFLSGGIGMDQLPDLQQLSQPLCYAIDVNSRFEDSPGWKDETLLKLFKLSLGC